MKVSINGVEQQESEFKGDTLGVILGSIVKQTPGSYIRRIWLDEKEFSIDDREVLQKTPSDIQSLEIELANLKDLVATNLANALDYLKKLIPGFEKAQIYSVRGMSRKLINITFKFWMGSTGFPKL